jgi:TfoX/Sxy family transcriptional regulator of competence genes
MGERVAYVRQVAADEGENDMATSPEYIDFVAEQVRGCGAVRYKKMFGEYMVYVNDKPILLVCEDTVFVKILPCLDMLMAQAEKGFPYDGAKEHYILDIDNAELAREVVATLEPVTPIPKPRKKKAPKAP